MRIVLCLILLLSAHEAGAWSLSNLTDQPQTVLWHDGTFAPSSTSKVHRTVIEAGRTHRFTTQRTSFQVQSLMKDWMHAQDLDGYAIWPDGTVAVQTRRRAGGMHH